MNAHTHQTMYQFAKEFLFAYQSMRKTGEEDRGGVFMDSNYVKFRVTRAAQIRPDGFGDRKFDKVAICQPFFEGPLMLVGTCGSRKALIAEALSSGCSREVGSWFVSLGDAIAKQAGCEMVDET